MYGIFAYIYLIFVGPMINVGKYTSPMDPIFGAAIFRHMFVFHGVFFKTTPVKIPFLKRTVRTWKWMVETLVSFLDGLVSGAFAVTFRGVTR